MGIQAMGLMTVDELKQQADRHRLRARLPDGAAACKRKRSSARAAPRRSRGSASFPRKSAASSALCSVNGRR